MITHQETLRTETPLLFGKAASMDVIKPRCAGLDVHKKTVVACVRWPGQRRGERRAETKTFATTMRGLGELRDWLLTHEVTDVAMESTGVYWRPVYAVLEGTVEVVLVNARQVKMVPGRKTDVKDLSGSRSCLRVCPKCSVTTSAGRRCGIWSTRVSSNASP